MADDEAREKYQARKEEAIETLERNDVTSFSLITQHPDEPVWIGAVHPRSYGGPTDYVTNLALHLMALEAIIADGADQILKDAIEDRNFLKRLGTDFEAPEGPYIQRVQKND